MGSWVRVSSPSKEAGMGGDRGVIGPARGVWASSVSDPSIMWLFIVSFCLWGVFYIGTVVYQVSCGKVLRRFGTWAKLIRAYNLTLYFCLLSSYQRKQIHIHPVTHIRKRSTQCQHTVAQRPRCSNLPSTTQRHALIRQARFVCLAPLLAH